MTLRRAAVAAVLLALAVPAFADVFRPAYLELRQRNDETFDVAWKVPAASDGRAHRASSIGSCGSSRSR